MKGKHRFARPRILIVGCGDVGLRIGTLLNERFTLFGTSRHATGNDTLRARGIAPVVADLDVPESLWRLRGLAPSVIHLAPPQNEGSGDSRTRHLVAALGSIRRLVYISTTGVYGDCQGRTIDETHTPHPQTDRAARRLDAERTLRAWARASGVRLTILRVPGIYAGDRLPLERLRAGTPVLEVQDDVYTNHIHADDLARISAVALWRGAAQRIYHASDDSDLLMGDYFDLLAEHFALPPAPRLARPLLAEAVSGMRYSFMQESRRLRNGRLKQELDLRLRYPRIIDALSALAQVHASEAGPR